MNKDNFQMPKTYQINDQKSLQGDTIEPAFYGFVFMAGLVIGGIVGKYYIAQR